MAASETQSLADLSVVEASQAIDQGRCTSEDLLQALFARCDAVEHVVHSYLRQDRAQALDAARAASRRAQQGPRIGPLDGIPFAVKDNIYTAGLATTAGSRVPQQHAASLQATLVTRLLAQGAVLVGKLNTWEYGTGTGAVHFDLAAPPATNPWNPAHFTGGSSSGSGAAVAAGTAMFAIGTDTGGSVRLPAAACGMVGLKPSFGRVSRHGIQPNCPSLDTPGPLTLTVEDAALVYRAIAGYDAADAASVQRDVDDPLPTLHDGVRGLRVGYVRTLDPLGPAVETPIRQALDRAAEALASAGAQLREITLPIAAAQYRSVALPINRSECSAVHRRDFLDHGHRMGRALREKLAAGLDIRAVDYLEALNRRRELTARTDAVFGDFDCLLLPMTGRCAPAFTDTEAVIDFTAGSAGSPFSLTGHPALSLPAGFTPDGLPVAVQLVAGFYGEALLLRVAQALQAALTPVPRRAPAQAAFSTC